MKTLQTLMNSLSDLYEFLRQIKLLVIDKTLCWGP